jgi:hypothetical protein
MVPGTGRTIDPSHPTGGRARAASIKRLTDFSAKLGPTNLQKDRRTLAGRRKIANNVGRLEVLRATCLSGTENEMKNPTVFVLGAGASAPFSSPLGSDWSRQIYDGLYEPNRPLANVLHHQLGHDYHILERFCKEFYLSGKGSIDAF